MLVSLSKWIFKQNKDMNNEESQQVFKLSSGWDKLDVVLTRITSPSLVTISGENGSGKSKLLHCMLSEALSRQVKVVHFVDIDLAFSRQRLLQVLHRRYSHLCESQIELMFQAIRVYAIFDVAQFLDLLQMIDADESMHNSMLILDSFTSLLLANCGQVTNRQALNRKLTETTTMCAQALIATTRRANLMTVVSLLVNNEIKFQWNTYLTADLHLSLHRRGNDMRIIMTSETLSCNLGPSGMVVEINDCVEQNT